jgi:Mn2+/Fe2+ NRAMP family transporter
MILAGSVVGSGELIMTTKLGAVAGFTLLWFVLLSCFVKVVVQAELARHTISSGETFLQVFNALPGPAGRRPLWLTLPWLAVVVLASLIAVAVFVQLAPASRTLLVAVGFGSCVVGVACIAAWTIASFHAREKHTADDELSRPRINWFIWLWLALLLLGFVNSGAILGGAGQALEMALPGLFGAGGSRWWAAVIAMIGGALLLSGSYGSLEKTLITLVATFTLLTVVCTVLLQWTGFAISWEDVRRGLSLAVPTPLTAGLLGTALAMFAGTGVAYGEMWSYTYWCVEKGYARNTGSPQPGEQWPRRARGWIRVMYTDVLLTMVVYTVSTVCFYLLGAAVLHAKNLDPEGRKTISTLSEMYTESVGSWSATLFVVGAFFVLFSTVLGSVAGNSRLMADGLGVMGIIDSRDYSARLRFIRIFVVVSLILFSIAYWLFQNPPKMLIFTSSIIGALMYPILGLGAIYLRYRQVDQRIVPSKLTTGWLCVCGIALAIISPGGAILALAIEFGWISFGS